MNDQLSKCNLCEYTSYNGGYLRRHMKIDHKREAAFTCSYGQSAMNSNDAGWEGPCCEMEVLYPIPAMHHADCPTFPF